MSLTITVVIPAHNEGDTIAQVVWSVLGQTTPPERVIVVSDGSTDDTALLAETAGAYVIHAPGGSKARAINLALDEVNTDLVVGVWTATQSSLRTSSSMW